MNRFQEFADIWKHKRAFMKTRRDNRFLRNNISYLRAINHDLLKSFDVLMSGDELASKWHRKYAGHHKKELMTYDERVEAYCDWECARFTKPDKQLNAEETWKTYFPRVNMKYINSAFKINDKSNYDATLYIKFHNSFRTVSAMNKLKRDFSKWRFYTPDTSGGSEKIECAIRPINIVCKEYFEKFSVLYRCDIKVDIYNKETYKIKFNE